MGERVTAYTDRTGTWRVRRELRRYGRGLLWCVVECQHIPRAAPVDPQAACGAARGGGAG